MPKYDDQGVRKKFKDQDPNLCPTPCDQDTKIKMNMCMIISKTFE